eukprot:m.165512 g.165512  ORF g.165512 m.165512 type:complete len:245 (+) comp10327_c0_seq16:1035-1769(+)
MPWYDARVYQVSTLRDAWKLPADAGAERGCVSGRRHSLRRRHTGRLESVRVAGSYLTWLDSYMRPLIPPTNSILLLACCSRQIFQHLTLNEVTFVTPTKPLRPRGVHLLPGQTLFLGGLGRVDLVDGPEAGVLFTFYGNTKIKPHKTGTAKADDLYQRHLGVGILKPPFGDETRVATLPTLSEHAVETTGQGFTQPACDLVFSGLGWLSVAGRYNSNIAIQCHTLEGRGFAQRAPLEMLRKPKQ